ncbi:MAG: sugar phosphate isomerase/epimerase family protein [Chloroflexota bacterium]
MTNATFTLSAFGDEIAPALEDQCSLLKELNVLHLELRATWGTNVLKMTNEDVAKVKQVLAEYGVQVSCLGSPVGKSAIIDPIQNELDNLTRLFQIGDALDTKNIRIFSFYPPDISTNAHYDQHVDEAVDRLNQMGALAENSGFYLMLENEKEIVGDTVDRMKKILAGIESPNVQFAWDPANFVQCGEANLTERAWPILSEYIGYIHIKDAVLEDGSVRPAGEGDGQVSELLAKLKETGYQGMLALEPHLKVAGHSSGFSGAGGMTLAVEALRKLMTEHNLTEVH